MEKLPKQFLISAKQCGFDIKQMIAKDTPHLFLHYNKILSIKEINGIVLKGRELSSGFVGEIRIKKDAKIKKPIYFCFGMTQNKGEQIILPEFVIEDGAEVEILAHCTFPNAKEIIHRMRAKVRIGKKANFIYKERHYHGEKSGARVFPDFDTFIDRGGIFKTSFILSEGTVGEVNINLLVNAERDSLCEIESKALGKNKNDNIFIYDKINLNGEDAKSLIKMRAAATGGGKVLMQGETYAKAARTFGHVDCKEIVQGAGSKAKAIPIVEVSNDQARVTHEASVGKINQKELDTLMARGLSEEQAAELIIRGLLG